MKHTQTKKQVIGGFDDSLEKFKSSGQSALKELSSQGLSMASETMKIITGQYQAERGETGLERLERQEIVDQKKGNIELIQGETIFSAEQYTYAREIEEVRRELYKALTELKAMGAQVKETEKAVKLEIVRPGAYHLNFFMRLREIIIVFRKQMSESRTWLTAMQSKKKKNGYWAMAKKHGTKWSMNSERALAASAG